MSSVKKIVIFRALKLGDMLCSIPAIRGIRKLHPDAHIALTGHPQMEALFSRYGSPGPCSLLGDHSLQS